MCIYVYIFPEIHELLLNRLQTDPKVKAQFAEFRKLRKWKFYLDNIVANDDNILLKWHSMSAMILSLYFDIFKQKSLYVDSDNPPRAVIASFKMRLSEVMDEELSNQVFELTNYCVRECFGFDLKNELSVDQVTGMNTIGFQNLSLRNEFENNGVGRNK